VAKLAFFVGKGGVGKTTVAAAYGLSIAIASRKNRVLLVSTDPAHSLADVLELKLARSPKAVPLRKARVWAWELDPLSLFREFMANYKSAILEIVERGSLFTAAEISPLLDTALPGMSEIAALIALRKAVDSKRYTHVVVDTAPFGHTIRLFDLPEQFSRVLKFLELAAGRDSVLAQHFGGGPTPQPLLLQEWRTTIEQITNAFSASDLILVTTPEEFALQESVRCMGELQSKNPGLKLKTVVLNRTLTRSGKCLLCRARVAAGVKAKKFLRGQFPSATIRVGVDPGFPILGASALAAFGKHVFEGEPLALKHRQLKSSSSYEPEMARVQWPNLNSHISFVLGKGGVGKTTISAALGFHSRVSKATPVHVCSVDPAPSLDDVFQTQVGSAPVAVLGDSHFAATELDSVALFNKWIAGIRDEVNSSTTDEGSGVHLDLSFERRLLSALLDIVPPGLNEVMAIFHISDLRSTGKGKIIIDMAPTGHALELLRMPERIVSWCRLLLKSLAAHRKLSLARNAAVQVAELELRARELSRSFNRPKEVSVFSVMLPEPLPDHETERLLSELNRLGLKSQALFVNRVLFQRDAANCEGCRISHAWQSSVLAKVRRRALARDVFVVQNFPRDIAGKKGLRTITQGLWRLK